MPTAGYAELLPMPSADSSSVASIARNDAGRAVNAGEPNWPASLRSEASDMYVRWERDLKPDGFRFGARVLEFPGSMPGDIGLFLTWTQ